MAYKIMIQGTMSNSGKSFLAAALCRIFRQDGYRTAPFKSQNMALNSYITGDGLEIGRAQAMQAEAAGIEPTVDMNPILLKPTSQMGSQVIVNGEVRGNMKAMEYYRRKPELVPVIRAAFTRLEEQYDVIVLEGAGSPAEINLRENDIVNMGMAEMADAPVLLVGDIDRGGVFASLYGTVELLKPQERARIKGLVINKFRGDVEILKPGLRMIEERLGIPVVGVIPMEEIDIDDEDSLAERLVNAGGVRGAEATKTGGGSTGQAQGGAEPALSVAAVRFPHISNFTDFNILERRAGVAFSYVESAARLGEPDLILLPGTKNTMADLRWLRESGLEAKILRLARERRTPVIGICGGYQMLGLWLHDPEGVEGEAGCVMRGMGLLPAETTFAGRKTRTRIAGRLLADGGMFAGYGGSELQGYEIHMGITRQATDGECAARPAIRLADGRTDGMERADGLVFGSYLHGLFDNEALTEALLGRLAAAKGVALAADGATESVRDYKERQYDRLANLVRRSLDMEQVYRAMGMRTPV